jgi:hypothetical protein
MELKMVGLPESKTVGGTGVTLKSVADEKMFKVVAERTKASDAKGTVRLNLAGLELPANVGLGVYVNLPDGERFPGADSPGYVGTVSSFGKGGAKDYALDLAPVLRKLAEKGLWDASQPIVIRLAAVSLKPRQPVGEAKVKLDKVTIELP